METRIQIMIQGRIFLQTNAFQMISVIAKYSLKMQEYTFRKTYVLLLLQCRNLPLNSDLETFTVYLVTFAVMSEFIIGFRLE